MKNLKKKKTKENLLKLFNLTKIMLIICAYLKKFIHSAVLINNDNDLLKMYIYIF